MCLHPIHAWYNNHCDEHGVRHLRFSPPSVDSLVSNYIPLPCGKCLGCLDDRRKRWINRLLLEFDAVGVGSFVTLTYAPEHVPDKPLKSHVQKFMKRFRNIPRDLKLTPLPHNFKYFFCGECGGLKGRPHYHGLLFGVDLMSEEWQPYIASFKDGKPLLSSKILEKKWPYGFCTIDSICPNHCRYVAKYTMKQLGQEDSFTLKSPRLGVEEFFFWVRNGRRTDYTFKYSDSADRLIDGNINVRDKNKLLNIRIPPSILRYADRVDPATYIDARMKRQLEAEIYATMKFDKNAYVECLLDQERKDKLKRKLH